YSIAKPIDEYFGTLSKNGTWTEMTGKIVRQEVDMGIIPMFIKFGLYSMVEFSETIGLRSAIFVVKAPQKFSNWSSIVAPFTFTMWISVFVTTIVFGLALHKVLKRDFLLQNIKVFWPRSKVFWNLFCTFVYQGINLGFIRRFSSRFMIGIWWISTVVLVSSYSGTLMSFMTYPVTETVPKTFDELANSVLMGKYSCGIPSKGEIWRRISNSKLKTAKIITDHITENNNFIKLSEGIERVQKERFALIYGEHVIKKIRRLFDSGFIDKIDHAEDSETIDASEFHELSVDEVISPILLLILGYIFRHTGFWALSRVSGLDGLPLPLHTSILDCDIKSSEDYVILERIVWKGAGVQVSKVVLDHGCVNYVTPRFISWTMPGRIVVIEVTSY
ncbi:glutamate receptor-like, partial [Centruroides sculpturatus]|uniref:glutamate receptor-like n=1 Tax=Centruroides sculpturatus TaxID=218467 RepID=UPI000C6E117D